MDRHDILAGIEVYAVEQAVIGETILEHGGRLTRDEFDQEFGVRRQFPVMFYELRSFILGGFGQGSWAKWLDLTQHMCLAGLIHEEWDENGRVVYCMNDG